MSARYPSLWRARVLQWVVPSLCASALVMAYAGTASVRRETLQGMEAAISFHTVWMSLTFGAGVLLVIDLVRKAPSGSFPSSALRLGACATLVVLSLFLPQMSYIVTTLPRVAALETEQAVASLVEFHGANEFWKNWTLQYELQKAVQEHAERITRDLRDYGLETDLIVIGAFPSSLRAKRNIHSETEDNSIELFEQRVRSIAAAQQCTHWKGEYARSIGLLVLSGLALGLIGGAVVAFGAGPASMRLRGMTSRALSVASRRRSQEASDAWLAKTFPVVWSARIDQGLPQLLAAPILVTVAGNSGSEVVSTICFVISAVSLILAFRSQETARHLTSRGGWDVAILIIHFGCVLFALALLLHFLGRAIPRGGEDALFAPLCVLVYCAAIQGARSATATTAYAGVVLGAGLMVIQFVVSDHVDTSGSATDFFMAASIAAIIAGLYCVIRWGARMELRSWLQRILIVALVTVCSFTGFAVVAAMDPSPSALSMLESISVILLGMGGIVAALRMTAEIRGRLAWRR